MNRKDKAYEVYNNRIKNVSLNMIKKLVFICLLQKRLLSLMRVMIYI